MAKQPWSREQWSKRIGMRIRGTYNPANWLLYALSFVFPRRRNLWVFGTAEDGFFDNSIYFFQYVSRTRTDIEAVWISNRDDLIRRLRERGFRVEKRRSFRGLWACLRAKYYFINHYLPDIHFFASGGATLVNFWHGVPLKKIEFDIDTGPRAHLWQAQMCIRDRCCLPAKKQCPWQFWNPWLWARQSLHQMLAGFQS